MVTRSIAEEPMAPSRPAASNAPGRKGGVRRRLASERALLVCLAIALVLHLPATPYGRSLMHWLVGDDEEEDQGEAIVPVEITLEEPSQEKTPPKVQPTSAPPPKPAEAPPKEEGTASQPPPPPPAPEPKPAPKVERAPRVSPVDGVADVKKLSKNPNNVSIIFVGSQLRTNSTGAKLGGLLASNAQWEGFFKGSDVDPVKDIDLMVLTGPQLSISGQVIAILRYSGDDKRIHAAIDNVVKSDKVSGAWLDDAPVPTARALADRQPRLFAMVPEKHLVYIIPSSYPDKKTRKRLEDKDQLETFLKRADKKDAAQLERVKQGTFDDFADVDFAIKAYMVEPWKLMGKDGKVDLPVVGGVELIPKTLDQATIVVVPKGDEADVSVTLISESESTAPHDAVELNKSWGLIRVGASFEYKLDLPDLNFVAKGREVTASAHLTKAALEAAFDVGKKKTEEARKKRLAAGE